MDNNKLKEKFNQDGYVFIPGFLSKMEVDLIRAKMEEFIATRLSEMPSNHIFYEDKNDPSSLKQLQDLQKYDEFFADILTGGKFERIAEVLLDDRVIGRTLEYFNKPAKIGQPTPPHQDNFYFMLNPPNAVTMWMALEDVDQGNGCVRYIKGSHLQGMRPHSRTQTLGFSQGITDYGEKEKESDEIAFPAKPGDLLIHHSMTIHRADGNKSETRTRKAMGLIYFSKSATEDVDAKKAYQQVLNAERSDK